MPTSVQLSNVHTWYDEAGAGEPLVMLHPAGTDARAFSPNIGALAARFHVYLPERRGHGHTPDTPGPFSFDQFAQDIIEFMERVVGAPAPLIGMSDGAIVGLHVAAKRPDLIRGLVVVAGVFHYDGWVAGVISDEPPPDFMAQAYAEVSPDGPDHFPTVVEKLARLHETDPALSTSDLARIASRTLVMVGDDDQVTLEHAVAMYRAIPNAELAVVPGTSHGLLVEKPGLCNELIVDFLTTQPLPTMAPIRRKSTP